jgi:PmbA protein
MVSNIDIGLKLTEQAAKLGADQSEAVVFTDEFSTTRFNNSIHQNIFRRNSGVFLTVITGGNRKGTVSISSLEQQILEKGLEQAIKVSKLSLPDPDFKSLPQDAEAKPITGLYIDETASLSPHEKGVFLREVIDRGLSYDRRVSYVAGHFTNGFREVSICNSLGLASTTKITNASLQVNVSAKKLNSTGSGYATFSDRDVTKIDPEKPVIEAAESSIMSLDAKSIEPGRYEVVLKPYAVAIMFSCLSDGFSTVSYREGRSFLSGHLGELVFDEKLTLTDDGRNLNSLTAMPFDGEGVPKKRFELIDKGVPKVICYDNYYAMIDGKENTGHKPHKIDRMDGWIYQDPIPTNLIVDPGKSSEEDLISDVKKGLLVSRLHYVTVVDEKEMILSGMTRDGTWLIKNGEIAGSVKNLRFTDSAVKALSKIGAIGGLSTVKSTLREHSGLLSSLSMPSMRLEDLHFTGSTEF